MTRGRPIEGDDDPRHGTENAYSNLGCRCTRCRGAHADAYYAQAQKPRVLPPGDPRHGNITGYTYWHCRCAACSAANAARSQARRASGRR